MLVLYLQFGLTSVDGICGLVEFLQFPLLSKDGQFADV